MNNNLNKLSEDWNKIDSVILYGAGINATVIRNVFDKTELSITYVIDRDKKKQGTMWNGIPIVDFEDVKDEIAGKKIVIMTAHTAYNQISEYLNRQGLKENIDYCSAGQFLSEWFWYKKNLNFIYHVDMTVTTRCTFNCANCNMFIPYYKETNDYAFQVLKKNIDLFFERIDYVAYFGLIGGETLLCRDLAETLNYLSSNYREKYGRVSFTTNGSVVPKDDVLMTLKENHVYVTISDYTKQIPYREKFETLLERLDMYGIEHEIKYALEWCDFGFPLNPSVYDDDELKEHLKACNPEWNGLNDGKFYYCNISWSAEKSGHFKLREEDYIDLVRIDPNDKKECHKIVELSRGTSSFCSVCGGCGSDNKRYVPIGVQL